MCSCVIVLVLQGTGLLFVKPLVLRCEFVLAGGQLVWRATAKLPVTKLLTWVHRLVPSVIKIPVPAATLLVK